MPRISLARKATLWVGLPFLIQALLAATLLLLLNEAQHLEDKEYRSKNLIGQANWLLARCLSINLNSLAQKLSNNAIDLVVIKHPNNTLSKEFEQLCGLYEPGDKRLVPMQQMQTQAVELEQTLDQWKRETNRTSVNAELKTLNGIWSQLTDARHNLLRLDVESYGVAANQSPQARKRVHQMALIITVADLILAVVLVYAFSRSIARRLKILGDNTILFASGKPLHNIVAGDDELTDYDRTFHQMAEQVAEATKKEREAHEAVVASEARVLAIINNMPLGLLALDSQYIIHSVNPSAEKLFGRTEEKLKGTHFIDAFADTHERNAFTSQEFSGSTQKTDLLAKRPNGELVHVEVSLTQFRNDQGAQLLACVQDTTERHEVERLKREFLAMVSHDLRSPLTTIGGTIDLISAGSYGAINDRGMKMLNTSSSEISRLTRLVQDLLDVARIESGKFDMEIVPLPLHHIIETSKTSTKYLADRKKISLVSEPTSLRVLADGDRLVQVLVNLLTNAIKFSPEGSSIEISIEEIDQSVEVRVKDYGRGIPESHIESVFDRYQQVERADATEKGGTGLGLAICKSIIAQHGGSIGVRSVLGQGSTFWFRVPKYVQQEPDRLP